jgi:hypothetical protein
MPETTTGPTTTTAPPYDRDAIFNQNGPFQPTFVQEAVRTLMRTLPLDPDEPPPWSSRRMHSAMIALAALHPRDEIEVMLGVQALSAYHAAAACWRIGMNLRRPCGDSIRHITAAASAARTFDTMLRALERRQAKPLAVPVGRPPPRAWPDVYPETFMREWEGRCGRCEDDPDPDANPVAVWTPEDVAATEALFERNRKEKENEGLDIANTEGILPGGGMILTEDPTEQQKAYMGRRLGLMYRRLHAENLSKGIRAMPKIRPIRPGDLIP